MTQENLLAENPKSTVNASHQKKVHVIAFDLPYPPDYGGATDIYHKVRSLHELGMEVILHIFLYRGKKPAAELESITSETHYYFRKTWVNPFWGKQPYVVSTRKSKKLLERLLQDNHPILFEGLHTTAYLTHPQLANRNKVVRAHNVEHHYYRALGDAELRTWKKQFFYLEAKRLERYEKVLTHANAIAAISPMETNYFQKTYGKTHYIPAFHSNGDVVSKTGKGEYVLYHGNLGIPENDRAARYLAEYVFPKLSIPCIIAGSKPSSALQDAVNQSNNILLEANLSAEKIFQRVQDAHVNVLVTFQSTGIKLKLLNSLYRGRFIVANTPMVDETQLESLCFIGDSPNFIAQQIDHLLNQDFTEKDIEARKSLLSQTFNNHHNAQLLSDLLQ